MNLINPKVPKILYDLGRSNVFLNRVRIYLHRNQRIVFTIIDNTGKEIRLSTNPNEWKLDSFMTVVASYNKLTNKMRLIINGKLVNEITTEALDLPKSIFGQGKQIIGCSLELDDPCSFYIGHFKIYIRELSLHECKTLMVAQNDKQVLAVNYHNK